MKLNKNHFSLLAFVAFLTFLFFEAEKTSKQEQLINEDIDRNLFVTVAKLKDCGRYNSSYIYYFDKKKYDGLYDGNGDSDSKIGKYFTVEISKKNPEFSRLIIEEEINDSIKISNSGFRKKKLDEILDAK
ncbi:hypothetical protein [Flavobacterium sp. LC2016-01]|uniref:hypothetical protein n=1 Tax=Flavobacterium sp. LC2016-01 TaxID=2675876 RepID=UPI0012BA8BB7|nr:hypothetical protein [Flavobacterium sp. LC2016-01]MTH17332.1 hypothetical protein [Flavobacterium sp. LC2016-01]